MVNSNNDSKDCVLVAIDIAKKSHDAVIHFPTGRRLTMKFNNTLAGYQLLLDRCKADQYSVQLVLSQRLTITEPSLFGWLNKVVNASWCHHFPALEREKCFTTRGIKMTVKMRRSFST